MIFRCFHTKNKKALVTAYKSYVRPLLEYCTEIWSPYKVTEIDRIEKVQRYFTRRLFERCDVRYVMYTERLRYLKLEPLELRRIVFDLKMLFKICHNIVDLVFDEFFKYASSIGVLRGHSYKLFKPFCRLDVRKYFFACRVVETWNELSQNTVNAASLNVFYNCLENTNLTKYCKFNRNI